MNTQIDTQTIKEFFASRISLLQTLKRTNSNNPVVLRKIDAPKKRHGVFLLPVQVSVFEQGRYTAKAMLVNKDNPSESVLINSKSKIIDEDGVLHLRVPKSLFGLRVSDTLLELKYLQIGKLDQVKQEDWTPLLKKRTTDYRFLVKH